ncbi:MAG: Flavin reductase [Myxococcales bacterium]|nr:Flavin reductase [Myxococcales bacterium]
MTSTKPLRLFVLGATGGTGRELVQQALERRHHVTAFVRAPHKMREPHDGLTVVQGDLLDVKALGAALTGHDAVVSTVGPPGPRRTTITHDSARATVAAMEATGVRRLLILGVAMLFEDAGVIATVLRKTLLRYVAGDSSAMELVVRASPLDWTIVRPPRLTAGPRTERYDVAEDRLPTGTGGTAKISRADVAHFLLSEAEAPLHVRRVVGIAYPNRKRARATPAHGSANT